MIYRHNPNAFLDWLTDLSWMQGSRGVLLVLRSSHRAWARWPYEMGVLVEVWLRAGDFWEGDGFPCHLVFDFPTPQDALD